MKLYVPFFRWVLFPFLALGNQFPGYHPDSLILRFDKSKKNYVESSIPQNEKSFTKDFRELRLLGVDFPPKSRVTITAQSFANPKTPYEAFANYLYTASLNDIKKEIEIHDVSSRRFIDSSLHNKEDSTFFFDGIKAIKRFETHSIFETPDVLILYGINYRTDGHSYDSWFLVKEVNVYKMKAGNIRIGFFSNLGSALQTNDKSWILKK